MPSVPDTSHLPWWLGPTESPSDALVKGVQAGSAIVSNMLRGRQMAMEAESNMRREEIATNFKFMELAQQSSRDSAMLELKRMDIGLESERNDIAIRSQNLKQQAEIGRAKAMLDMGDYMGNAVQNDKLTDPETIAGWHRLTAKLAPFVPDTVANAWYDNTFKPAIERKNRADGKGDATVTERDMAQWKFLLKAEQEATDEDAKRNASVERQMFERMKGVGEIAAGPPQSGVDFGISNVGESEQIWLRNPKTGALSFRAMPKTGISATDQQKIEYASRVKALQDAFDDRQLKGSDGTRADFNEYQRQLDRLNEEFRTKASTPAPTAPASAPGAAPVSNEQDPLGLFR